MCLSGHESFESTGYITTKHTKFIFDVSNRRKTPHIIVLDEPEIGMSDELQAGVALWMRKRLCTWPRMLMGIVVFTHSKPFASEFKKLDEVLFYNFDGFTSVEEWVNRDIVALLPDDFLNEALLKQQTIGRLMEKVLNM